MTEEPTDYNHMLATALDAEVLAMVLTLVAFCKLKPGKHKAVVRFQLKENANSFDVFDRYVTMEDPHD